MRVLLFTGKGGVGKSTLAAATAVLTASRGQRTLVVSTDTAHSLGDAFEVEVGGEPVAVAPHLWVQHVDAQRRFEESWAEVQGYLLEVMAAVGVDPVAAEELTVLPGAEEVLALLELSRQAASGRFDVIVVDCAPTAETLRLLALPEALNWYMKRVFPAERRVMRTLGPVIGKAVGVPMPRDGVFDAVERLHAELAQVRELLVGPAATVRLVMTPERVVLAEARRAWTTLSMYGYRVDGVVANRFFAAPADTAALPGEPRAATPSPVTPTPAEDWVAGWARAQGEVFEEAITSFAPMEVRRQTYCAEEPRGIEALLEVATSLYGDDDPTTEGPGVGTLRVRLEGDRATLSLPLPLAVRGDVDLVRRAGDLVVTCGTYRRVLTLPAALTRLRVAKAGIDAGALTVTFERGSAGNDGDGIGGLR